MRNFFSILILLFIFSTPNLIAQDTTKVADQGTYSGKLKRGLRHGFGTCTWQDGRKYSGKWKNNLMNGKGTMIYQNGDKYVGDWVNGSKSGYGTYTWTDGSTYTGAYRNGKKSGWGILKLPNGSKHEGYWKNDLANGKGKHYWVNGSQYYGDWKDNKRHGSGVLEYKDGSVVQGEWENDEYIPCKCVNNLSTFNADSAYKQYDAIFVGKISEIYQDDEGTDAIVFQISQYWKGEHGFNRKITLHAGYKSCDFIFYEGVSYLVFANTASDDKFYQTDKCSPSGEAQFKTLEIKALESLKCQQKPKKTPFSIQDFDPVCGCDGKTYDNPYKAKVKGLLYWKEGACSEK